MSKTRSHQLHQKPTDGNDASGLPTACQNLVTGVGVGVGVGRRTWRRQWRTWTPTTCVDQTTRRGVTPKWPLTIAGQTSSSPPPLPRRLLPISSSSSSNREPLLWSCSTGRGPHSHPFLLRLDSFNTILRKNITLFIANKMYLLKK